MYQIFLRLKPALLSYLSFISKGWSVPDLLCLTLRCVCVINSIM
jgi:hypothetical protein